MARKEPLAVPIRRERTTGDIVARLQRIAAFNDRSIFGLEIFIRDIFFRSFLQRSRTVGYRHRVSIHAALGN